MTEMTGGLNHAIEQDASRLLKNGSLRAAKLFLYNSGQPNG